MSAQLTRKRFTVDDCLRMEEAGILSPNDHVELIRGEILVMSPIGPRHGAAVDGTAEAMVELSARKAIVRTQGTVVLDRFAAPQPDIALLRPKEDRYVSGNPGGSPIFCCRRISHGLSGLNGFNLRNPRNPRLNLSPILLSIC